MSSSASERLNLRRQRRKARGFYSKTASASSESVPDVNVEMLKVLREIEDCLKQQDSRLEVLFSSMRNTKNRSSRSNISNRTDDSYDSVVAIDKAEDSEVQSGDDGGTEVGGRDSNKGTVQLSLAQLGM